MILVLSLYLQFSLGLNPMYAGFALVPFSFAFLLGSAISGKINGLPRRGFTPSRCRYPEVGIVALALEAGRAPGHLTPELCIDLFPLWDRARNRHFTSLQYGAKRHSA